MARRRGNKEGSYTKLKDGRWQGRISLEDGSRKAVYGRSYEACREKLEALKGKVKEGSFTKEDMSVKEYLNKWLAYRALVVKPKTLNEDQEQCQRYIIPALGKKRLSELTVLHVQEMMNGLAASVSASRANRSRKVLRNALGQAVRWQVITRNPVDATRKLKEPKTEMTIWAYDEAARFLEAAKGHRLYPLFLLAMRTGLRVSEVLGLRWQDVKGGNVHVRHTAVEVKGKLEFAETTKTDHSNRLVSLPLDVQAALAAHRQAQAAHHQKLGFHGGLDLVFDSLAGIPISHSNLKRAYETLKARAGVPHATFHDLRHWHVSMLLEEGVDIRLIAKRLGHADPSITLRTYSHLIDRQAHIEPISLNNVLPVPAEREPAYLN